MVCSQVLISRQWFGGKQKAGNFFYIRENCGYVIIHGLIFNMNQIEVLVNRKGTARALVAGYVYTKTKSSKSTLIWKCSNKVKYSCHGTLGTTLPDNQQRYYYNPRNLHPHNHAPQDDFVNATRAKFHMMEEAATTFANAPRAILGKPKKK